MAYLNSRPQTPTVCPVCGEDVPPRALACRECGADHQSGWKQDFSDGLDLPDEEFDYDQFVKREFSDAAPSGLKPIWWITAILILLIFAIWMALGIF